MMMQSLSGYTRNTSCPLMFPLGLEMKLLTFQYILHDTFHIIPLVPIVTLTADFIRRGFCLHKPHGNLTGPGLKLMSFESPMSRMIQHIRRKPLERSLLGHTFFAKGVCPGTLFEIPSANTGGVSWGHTF